jgi:hypothetical protein
MKISYHDPEKKRTRSQATLCIPIHLGMENVMHEFEASGRFPIVKLLDDRMFYINGYLILLHQEIGLNQMLLYVTQSHILSYLGLVLLSPVHCSQNFVWLCIKVF